IISDVVVVLILAPVVVRLCHFLKIRSGTYLLGMTICINIGSIITPFSSGENIIISTEFSLDTLYFVQYFWFFSFSLLFITIFLIEHFILSKEPKIEENQKKFVLELIDTDVVIKNKAMFYFNAIAIVATITLFAIVSEIYLVAAISALIMVLVNALVTRVKLSNMLRDIEWEIIFFFISLYVVIHCLIVAGFQDIFELLFGGIEIASQDPISAMFTSFGMCLLILVIVSGLSGFVANTPTALIFIPIVQILLDQGIPSVPLFFAFIIGINLGGNFLPQGAACDMMTLKIAEDRGVENLNIKRLTKVGASFAGIHIGISILYLFLLNWLIFAFGLV
ncbi:MAG: SLC13 family permease, partial [Promethearchaeota archaeon]